jgi:protein-S-isoprenylcysteine O-methyltransferase Ste14
MKPSVAWALVGAQFGLIAGLIVLPYGGLWPRGTVAFIVAGIAIVLGILVATLAALRLGFALTPVPIPKEGADLVTSGIYHWIRHPIYTGVLLAAAGLVVLGASLGHLVGWWALFAVLSIKAAGEERMLAKVHEGYGAYKRTTGRLFPRLLRGNSS